MRSATRRERGVVVVVALAAALMMALSAAALLHSVETTLVISGNLGAMNAARHAADAAVERAVAALFETQEVADPAFDDGARGYSAVRRPGESVRGVPVVLQALTGYPSSAPAVDAGDGAVVRYIIERMCATPGPPSTATCQLVPAGSVPVAPDGATEPPWVPLYRLTVRVDGPGAASAFAQAWLADLPTGRRLAWRTLGD